MAVNVNGYNYLKCMTMELFYLVSSLNVICHKPGFEPQLFMKPYTFAESISGFVSHLCLHEFTLYYHTRIPCKNNLSGSYFE